MKKFKDIALGVVTAIGGFVDAGELITSAQAGALFQWSLLWVVVVCVLLAILYEAMAARVAMGTNRALFDAVRERMGWRLALIPLLAVCAVNLLTLVAEIAGMAFALEMASGWSFLVWAAPCALLLWFILWKGSFSLIENGASALGMFILVFVWAALALRPPWGQVATQMWRPDPHGHSWTLLAYSAVGLVGAYVAPYEMLFYSSGAVEEEWGPDYLWPNRLIASIGNVLGGVVAACIIIVSAMVLFPQGIQVEQIRISAIGPVTALGMKGFWLFVAGALFCSMAAGLELALSATYAVTEYFGWHWKKDEPAARSAMFHLVYMLFLLGALGIVVSGLNPIKVTDMGMVFNAVALPLTLLPLLLVAGDRRYAPAPLTNGPIVRWLGWAGFAVLLVVAIAGVPLFIITGGGG
jgi:Mn2+/Fe2+ NRAMP family transporter